LTMKCVPSKEQFPLWSVNLCLFFTILLFSSIFRLEALENKIHYRWRSNITWFTMEPIDYRNELFATHFNAAGFGLWTAEVAITLWIVYYHISTPHHPKFYSTSKNKISIVAHIIGGTVAILGLWIGALVNSKEVCIVAVLFGFFLHWPSLIWQMRQLHGHREIMVPSYCCVATLLFQNYIEFFLYNGSFKTVFSCAMNLNIFSVVRASIYLAERAHLQTSYDRAVLFAGLINAPFVVGNFGPMLMVVSIIIWNLYFDLLKPLSREVMRIDRGYNDAVPDEVETIRGLCFCDELEKVSSECPNKREAIAKALFRVLADDDGNLSVKDIVDLYKSWGMPDAEKAARATFKNVDFDESRRVEFEEFKKGFKVIIDGIFVKGEYQKMGDSYKIVKMK